MIGFSGNMLLMMYYTTITAWLIVYAIQYANGSIMQSERVGSIPEHFSSFITNVPLVLSFLFIAIIF